MIKIYKSAHPYFISLANYLQAEMDQPSIITDDLEQEGPWLLDYYAYTIGIHRQIKGPYIAVQSEQMNAKGSAEYRHFLQNAAFVLDMNTNMRVGYSDYWKLEMEKAKDIDVLFYGLVNQRRMEMLLHVPGLIIAKDYYGPEIMKMVMRSKIVISTHYYTQPMNDMARIAPLITNNAFVLAETTTDEQFNNWYPQELQFKTAEELKDKAKRFLHSPEQRVYWAGYVYESLLKEHKPIKIPL